MLRIVYFVTRIFSFLAFLLMGYGAIGFIGPMEFPEKILAINSGEWPLYGARNVQVIDDRYYVVPSDHPGRIQIYDLGMNYIRGWSVPSGGAGIKIAVDNNNDIEVYTARGKHQVYDLDGVRKLDEKYRDVIDYDDIPSVGAVLKFESPIYLYVFSSPFLAWLLAVLGAVLFSIFRVAKLKCKKRINKSLGVTSTTEARKLLATVENSKEEKRALSENSIFNFMGNVGVPEENGDYAGKWSEFRIKRNVCLASIFGWFASAFALGFLWSIPFFIIVWFAANIFVLYRCPRCNERFTTENVFLGDKKCSNCSLGRFKFDSAASEND